MRARIASSAYDVCVVTNEHGIVDGIVRADDLEASDDARVEAMMKHAPSTFRPNVPIDELAEYLTTHDLASAPITSSDGRLLGLLLRDDAVAAAG